MKIRTKFILFNCLIVTIALAATIAASLSMFDKELSRQAQTSQEIRIKTFWELFKTKGTTWRITDGKLMVGEYVVNGNFELPDKLKELSGGTATIFMDDERVSTNVVKPDGSRAIGTKLTGPAYEAIFKKGVSYRGEAEILGTRYFTAYDPIKNDQGTTIGVLYVGVKKSEFYAAYNHLKIIIAIITGIVLLVSGIVSRFIIHRLFIPLNLMHDLLDNLAIGEGDLTKRLAYDNRNEIGDMCRSFNIFMEKLQTTISQIVGITSQLAGASVQMQETSRQIAQGTGQVSSESVGVATATEEMAATSSEIAKNCIIAVNEAVRTTSSAQSGVTIVEQTVANMNSIAARVTSAATTVEALGHRSDQIGEIIGTIEDIADQTNLLALNAAIEAARAGEQGRGFAVVADEVRALAERTTKATRTIGEMISAIQSETSTAVESMNQGVEDVAIGVQGARHSGEALGAILDQIATVTSQLNQIATAAEQQTATTHEISKNMTRISDVVHSTADNAQDSADSAQQLNTLAHDLKSVVGRFKLT